MKIDRLIGIIILLLQTEKMTAPELAIKFEVSRRTINRDVEDICKAGIPIVTTMGVNGGISIIDNYKISKTLFTDKELRAIFAGLSSLDSISQDRKYQNIMDKFSGNKNTIFSENHILIDLSSHYKDTLAPKIKLLQENIENSSSVFFVYYNSSGEKSSTINPYLIVFQWSSWYLLGHDYNENKFKLYKLNRISEIKSTDKQFEYIEIPKENLNFAGYFTDEIEVVILFDKTEKYRLIDEYGLESFQETSYGKLRFSFSFTNSDYLISWVLGFGEKAELIEPKELRFVMEERLEKALCHMSV